MEAGLCIEDASRIRVVVAPVGEICVEALRDYISAVTQHERIQLNNVSSFYTAHQKSPFARQSWENGSLRFKFILGRCGRSPWEDFQAYRRVHAVIGLCHCPSNPDLDTAYDKFVDMCNDYPSAQTRRLFAFHPSEEQITLDDKKRQNMVLFPPFDAQSLKHHMQTLMQDFAASVLMAFEDRVLFAEQMGATLTTPMDSPHLLISEDVNKAKRRRLERVQKIMGDYCLLAGSPQDASSHYSSAIEFSRHHTGDAFWNAGALEGSICTIRLTDSENTPEEDVRYRYYEVIQLYRRSTAPYFEVEAALKLARFLCRRELRKDTSREVAELLTGAVEVGKNLSDKDDRLILFVEVAQIFQAVHYERKAAFFLRQVAQMYQAQNSVQAAKSALQILLLAAPSYGVEKRKTPAVKTENDSVEEQQQTRDYWSALQISMLGDILAVSARASDPLTAWIAGARLLRFHYPFITPAAQMSLVSALWTASRRLPPGTRCLEPGLPFVRLLSFPPLPSGTEIIRKVPGKKDWWVESTTPGGPFIYTPVPAKGATSKNDTVTWVVGEYVEVLVEVANPCAFEVSIQDLSLSVDGTSFEAFPLSVTLQPNTSQTLRLLGIPQQAGTVKLRGCFLNFTGVTTEHLFEEVEELLIQAAKGVILVDPFRGGERRSVGFSSPEITVTPTLPLLAARIVGGDGNVVLYEGEIRQVHIDLTNIGNLPVVEACLNFSGKQKEHAVRIQHARLEAALPLQPGATVSIPVELRAGQTSVEESVIQTAKSHPLILLHYAGWEDELIGRRLALPLQIHVRKGLGLVQARLLSMDVPVQVTSRHLDPEGLVKVDPYRGGWSFRVLELELWNPTEVPFEITVYVEKNDDEDGEVEAAGITRIDSNYSSRLLVPLERLKLPTLEKVFTGQVPLDKAESIEEASSKIRLKWQSGRNNVGELNVADAIKAALQASMAELLLSNPLTFGFRLGNEADDVRAHELTPIEMFVRNNTSNAISLVLSVTCRDVAGENCFDRKDEDSVLWSGILSGIRVEVPALSQHVHSFVLCFMVPGDYTLLAAAVIPDPVVVNKVEARHQGEHPASYCGPPFSVQVKQ